MTGIAGSASGCPRTSLEGHLHHCSWTLKTGLLTSKGFGNWMEADEVCVIPFLVPTNFVSNNGLEVHWDHPIDRPHLATPTASYSLLLSLVVIPVPFLPQTSCQPYWTKGFSWPLAFELLSQPWSKSPQSQWHIYRGLGYGPWCCTFTLPCHGHRQNLI